MTPNNDAMMQMTKDMTSHSSRKAAMIDGSSNKSGSYSENRNGNQNGTQGCGKGEVSPKTYEKGSLMHERDRKRATQLFRTQSMGKNSMSVDVEETEQESLLGNFEPDWTKFESVFATDLLPNAHGHIATPLFLQEVVDILVDYIRKTNDRSSKVLDFHHPSTLKEMMAHCLDIQEEPQNLEQILSDCKETLKYCVKTGHPRFFNQLSTGLDMIALAGEWLTATANTNMFTYEIAPVFTLMENIVLTKMREHVGWSEGDGIFAPGGAISNLYAVACARHFYLPEAKSAGMAGMPRMVVFTSEHAHFSIKRAGLLLGIGTENVVLIKTDKSGKMLVSDLEAKIQVALADGSKPFFVSATAGTTVLGSFDPLHEIADVCEKYNLWFHVDGAWGGSALLSKKYKGLLSGVERANSMTWNPHKLMGSLLQCSAIILPEVGHLEACNSLKANYLFQKDKHYDLTYDTGDKAIQCGRHNDVFKLWLLWRAKGDAGFEKQLDRLLGLSQYLQSKIKERPGFQFVLDKPEFINTCFWYIPVALRDMPESAEKNEQINKVAPRVKAMMMERGNTMVGYQPIGDKPNFFRMIISNPAATFGDVDFLIDEIERLGEKTD